MKENTEVQKNLFSAIKVKLPTHLSMPMEVAEALNISTDSAYRRIRGEIALTLDELKRLADHFHFSIDQMLQLKQETILFFGKAIEQNENDFYTHLNSISNHVQTFLQAHERLIYCSAKDIPLFHYYNFKEITAFKVYFWLKNIIGVPSLKDVKFSFDFGSEMTPIAKKSLHSYNLCDGIEIWSYETISNVLRQIDFCFYTGLFQSKEQLSILFEQLDQLLDHIEKQVEYGIKFPVGSSPDQGTSSFQMFVNEVVIGNNVFLIDLDGNKQVFLNHAVVNYIVTGDDHFCSMTEVYFKNLMKKSLSISGSSEKERVRFFNQMREEIDLKQDKLLNY